MKLLFLRSFNVKDREYLVKNLSDLYDICIPDDFSENNLAKAIKDATVCIGNNITRKVLDQAKMLKVLQVPGAGINNFKSEIFSSYEGKVCNSHSNAKFVAEFGVALLFTLLKKIHLHDQKMRVGQWFKPTNTDDDLYYLSDSLYDKNVGFVGFGAIGKKAARLLAPYDCKFFANDPNPNTDIATFLPLDDLIKKSDVLFITVPLTSKTLNLINKERFELMKNSALLVNISRGDIVDEDDLYQALSKKQIAGAAIDVWYDMLIENDLKYPSKRNPFHKLKNIVLSPYRAGYLMDLSPHLFDVVKNLRLFAKTGELINVVNVKEGY